MEKSLADVLSAIKPLDAAAMDAARARQARLAKPPHSLGRLEDISVQLAGITGCVGSPVDRRRVLIFAADNGVVAEGVASCPQTVTLAQTLNFTRGLTGVAVLARHFHAELDVTDVGINAAIPLPGVHSRKVAMGTGNIAKAPAMTRAQCLQAMEAGFEAVRRAKDDGMQIIGIGEMGIGNTTTSSAVLSALLGVPARDTVSRGAGIDDNAFRRKRQVVDAAIRRLQPDPADPVDVIAKVGGFDIAAMCAAFLAAAAQRLPVVIDGFISAVAALCASRLCGLSAQYMLPSHASAERGYSLAMAALGLVPMLNLGMRLGEGSGCPIAFELCAAAQAVVNEMATFREAAIDDGYLDSIRGNKAFLGEV